MSLDLSSTAVLAGWPTVTRSVKGSTKWPKSARNLNRGERGRKRGPLLPAMTGNLGNGGARFSFTNYRVQLPKMTQNPFWALGGTNDMRSELGVGLGSFRMAFHDASRSQADEEGAPRVFLIALPQS